METRRAAYLHWRIRMSLLGTDEGRGDAAESKKPKLLKVKMSWDGERPSLSLFCDSQKRKSKQERHKKLLFLQPSSCFAILRRWQIRELPPRVYSTTTISNNVVIIIISLESSAHGPDPVAAKREVWEVQPAARRLPHLRTKQPPAAFPL